MFNGQLEKTGAGYFDYYLIYGVESSMLEKYEGLDCFNWLLAKKEQGLVRHAGFSFHDTPELLDTLLTKYPAMEFVIYTLDFRVGASITDILKKYGINDVTVIQIAVSKLTSKNVFENQPAPWIISAKAGD